VSADRGSPVEVEFDGGSNGAKISAGGSILSPWGVGGEKKKKLQKCGNHTKKKKKKKKKQRTIAKQLEKNPPKITPKHLKKAFSDIIKIASKSHQNGLKMTQND
jgi:hypothetical protein